MSELTTNGWTTREALMDREPFTTHGALSAVAGHVSYTGQLPEPWATEYRSNTAQIVYTVMSYQTPIAWVYDNGAVVIPRELSGRNKGEPVKYSRTTSGHQGMLYALDTERLSFTQKAGIRESAERERQHARDRRNRVTEAHTAPYATHYSYTPFAPTASNDWYNRGDSATSTASDYDALIAEVGELSRPVR